jgi:hypothetical protein
MHWSELDEIISGHCVANSFSTFEERSWGSLPAGSNRNANHEEHILHRLAILEPRLVTTATHTGSHTSTRYQGLSKICRVEFLSLRYTSRLFKESSCMHVYMACSVLAKVRTSHVGGSAFASYAITSYHDPYPAARALLPYNTLLFEPCFA